MSGTSAGALIARDKNLAKNPNFYKEIGAKGGRAGNTGGFQKGSLLAVESGRRGGTISRRGPIITPTEQETQSAMKVWWNGLRRKVS